MDWILPMRQNTPSYIYYTGLNNKEDFLGSTISYYSKTSNLLHNLHVVFSWKKNMFCFFLNMLKKTRVKMFFFLKPPVFKVNIHNLSQFVNHTVTLVQTKNNNERISLKWGLCG